jgi:hypothetical protein
MTDVTGEVATTTELVERIEAATGPDRELDAAVGEAVGAEPLMICDTGNVPIYSSFTASLDAAMSLVGDAWWFVERTPCADGYDAEVAEEKSRGATPALALTAAALKARIAMEKE